MRTNSKKYEVRFLLIHRSKLIVPVLLCMLYACKVGKYDLSNSKWVAAKITVDSVNHLTPIEKNILSYVNSVKIYSDFRDSTVITQAEGGEPDTSNYKVKNDTLFFWYTSEQRDTNIILKLTSDSFIQHRLAGMTVYSIKQK